MANTRSKSGQQQQLNVKADSDGNGQLDTVPPSGKRKQDSSNGTTDHAEDNQEPPAKSAKTHDESKAKSSKQTSEHENVIRDASKQATDTKGEEKKVEGEDVGPVGSKQDDVKWEVLERGHVYFFYRPKVQPDKGEDDNQPAAKSIDDTQNTHMLLLPRSSDSDTAPAKPASQQPNDIDNKSEQTGEKARQGGIGARLIRLGKKRMPEPNAAIATGNQPGGIGGDSSETIWSVISDVSPSFDALKDSFAERRYKTKTAGDRVVRSARPAGRGWYAITLSQTEPPSSREVRLSYVLSHPHDDAEFGDVQKELGLSKESSVRLQMRNPTLPSTGDGAPPAGLDPSDRVELDKGELKDTFGGDADEGTRYARPENLELLDRAGVELLMIKKKGQEAEKDFGLGEKHRAALEKLASDDAKSLSNEDVLSAVHLDSTENPPDALDGEWI